MNTADIEQEQSEQIILQNENHDEQFAGPKDAEKCAEYKKVATEYFQSADYDDAIDQYKLALECCPDDDAKMKCILNSNIGICHKMLSNYEGAIEFTSKALEYDCSFSKALLNRAFAYENTDKPEEALEDYKKLQAITPNDKTINKKVQELEAKVAQLTEQRKDEVLKGLKDLGNTILGKFGMSLDNFKLQQNENGSYNVQFQQ